MYCVSRKATAKEIRNYTIIEERTAGYDDGEFIEFIEMVSDYVFNDEHKAELTRIGKEWGITLKGFVDWYCMELD